MIYEKIDLQMNYTKIFNTQNNVSPVNTEEMMHIISSTTKVQVKSYEDILALLQRENTALLSKDLSEINFIALKRHLILVDKFLLLIDSYLSELIGNEVEIENSENVIHSLFKLIAEISSFFDNEDLLKLIKQENKQLQIIDQMTNLLNLQIKIADKINEKSS